MVSTFETGLGTFVVSRSPQVRRPLAIYGPTPPAARSPLLLRLRPLYAEVGAPVVVHARRGALRLPWIERIRKPSPGGP